MVRLGPTAIDTGRATQLSWTTDPTGETRQAYVAAERLALVRLVLPMATADPELQLPERLMGVPASEEEATRRIIHGWIEALGPTTASQLSRRLGIAASKIETALLALESDGIVLRGEFTGARGDEVEWCDRVLLSRIHRLTLGRMRKEIEPVSAADFMRFLLAWQHVTARDPTAWARRRFGSHPPVAGTGAAGASMGAARFVCAD